MTIHEDHLESDPRSGSDEKALLIIQQVVCACGADWTESNLIFKGAGYSYHLTQQRYVALLNNTLPVVGRRVHARIVPICHNCRGHHLPTGWDDTRDASSDPHYPYEQWPDKHKEALVAKARKKPKKTETEISSLVDNLMDDI